MKINIEGRKPVPANSMLSVLSLGAKCGTEVTITAEGDGADAVLEDLATLLARDLDADEAVPMAESPRGPNTEPPGGPNAEPLRGPSAEPLHGIGVSPGFAAGPVCRAGAAPRMPAERVVSDVEAELAGAARTRCVRSRPSSAGARTPRATPPPRRSFARR